MSKIGTVKVAFTPGFGNNMFQYVFCRLLSESKGMKYNHPPIPEMGIIANDEPMNKKLKTIKIKVTSKRDNGSDEIFRKYLKKCKPNCNYYFFGYFEDYAIYKPHLDRIRLWFPSVPKTNTTDLVLHLRLQNRLVQQTHAKNFISFEKYQNAIEQFKFEKLYIVTDCKTWRYLEKQDVEDLQKQFASVTKEGGFASPDQTIGYMNSMIDGFSQYNPIIRNSPKFIDDFNFIRTFDQVLFKDSTFTWWATVLSKASKVGVYGPWKPNKGNIRNKNLGHTDYPGWFSWGEG